MSTRIDSTIWKDVEMGRRLKSRLDGLDGVFKALAEQHAELLSMMKRLQNHPEMKPELWPEIRRELLSHERAEAKELYPVLRRYPQTQALADQHALEATEIESMIAELDTDIDDWQVFYAELVDTVIDHADQEENEIFPRAQAAIGEGAAKDLESRFLAMKTTIAASA
jgi:hemerythrin superfamily protein